MSVEFLATAADSMIGGSQGGILGFAYNIVAGFRKGVKIEPEEKGGCSNIPKNRFVVPEARVEWHGLWYTHTEWWGRKSDDERRQIKEDEVKRNLNAQQVREGKPVGVLDLKSTGLVVPLVVSYVVYRVDVEPSLAAIGAKKAKLIERKIAAHKDLSEVRKLNREAEKYLADSGGSAEDIAALREQNKAVEHRLERYVRDLRRQIKQEGIAIKDARNALRAEVAAGTRYMGGFTIAKTDEYLKKKQYVPLWVEADGKFSIKADAATDKLRPCFEITFEWKEKFAHVGSYGPHSETFLWTPDGGPIGDGKFVTRFTTGAQRVQVDVTPKGDVIVKEPVERKPIIFEEHKPDGLTMHGKSVGYDPRPLTQLPVGHTQAELIAKHRGFGRDVDAVSKNAPTAPPTTVHVPGETRTAVPGERFWTELLERYKVKPSRARPDVRGLNLSSRQGFYQAVASVDREFKLYWDGFVSGASDDEQTEVRRILERHVTTLEQAAVDYEQYLRGRQTERDIARADAIKAFGTECSALFKRLHQAQKESRVRRQRRQ